MAGGDLRGEGGAERLDRLIQSFASADYRADGLEVEVELDEGEVTQRLGQELVIPVRGLGQLVVGDRTGARLLGRQVVEANRRSTRARWGFHALAA